MSNDNKPLIKGSIVRFSRLVSEAEDAAKENCDIKELTSTQLNYLEAINELSGPSTTELAAAMGITKPTVTIAIERLIQKGCVYKVNSNADKRSFHLYLTEVGIQINKRHDYAHDYLTDLISESLDTEEQSVLVRLLEKVSAFHKTNKQ